MKKILMMLFVLVAVGALSAFAAGSSPAQHSCCAAAPKAEPAPSHVTGNSVYQLDATWTNDSGAVLKLASLRGRPQIVTMFFANCVYACPLLVSQMKQIEAELPEPLRSQVGFVLVSFDTERDTPAVLHNYRLQHELPQQRWTLLRGNPDEVLDLAAVLNVKFTKDAQGQFLHSNVITLLDADGAVVYQQLGLNSPHQELVRRLTALAGN